MPRARLAAVAIAVPTFAFPALLAATLTACAGPGQVQGAAASPRGGPSVQFQIGGAVARPATYDQAALRALPPSHQTVGSHDYTGVPVWTLLESAGLSVNPGVKNGVLAGYLVARGSDGYTVTFSLGELAPTFGNQPVMVAYAVDGAPLGTGGFARLVVPADVKAGRAVANLTSLEVVAVPSAKGQ